MKKKSIDKSMMKMIDYKIEKFIHPRGNDWRVNSGGTVYFNPFMNLSPLFQFKFFGRKFKTVMVEPIAFYKRELATGKNENENDTL